MAAQPRYLWWVTFSNNKTKQASLRGKNIFAFIGLSNLGRNKEHAVHMASAFHIKDMQKSKCFVDVPDKGNHEYEILITIHAKLGKMQNAHTNTHIPRLSTKSLIKQSRTWV